MPCTRTPPDLHWQVRRLGIRQRELAEAVGVSYNYMRQVAAGSATPSAALRARIAAHLGLDEAELFGSTS